MIIHIFAVYLLKHLTFMTTQYSKNSGLTIASELDLPTHLATLTVAKRRIWVEQLRRVLAMLNISLRDIEAHMASQESLKITYFNIQNVMNGTSYNPSFGPLVVRAALVLIKQKKQEKSQTSFEASEFFTGLLNEQA